MTLYRFDEHGAKNPMPRLSWLREGLNRGWIVPVEKCEHGNYARHLVRQDLSIWCEGATPAERECGCATCFPHSNRMIVCTECGNKRCPKATDHRLDCTRSNKPGQKGSSWETYQIPKEDKQ